MFNRNRSCCEVNGEERGMDDSLLFFFLILVFLFCNPSRFGCGRTGDSSSDNDCYECCECRESRRMYDCDDDCDC